MKICETSCPHFDNLTVSLICGFLFGKKIMFANANRDDVTTIQCPVVQN